MSEPVRVQPAVTPEDYLAAERVAVVKHEYLGGQVHAMSGASMAHNRIVHNWHEVLGRHLAGHSCEVVGADMKLRVASDVFDYPDVMVCCEPISDTADYTESARVVIEVTSASTRRIDEREKAQAYWSLPSIEVYVLVAQDVVWVRVLRRGERGWETESLTHAGDVVRLESLSLVAPLTAIYARTEVAQAADM
ncbi:MAG: Uma2 family endonuclease [Armatimonadetes bacterium]|nr:Uma2 family endonuclease [Armatimonadota bacterium]